MGKNRLKTIENRALRMIVDFKWPKLETFYVLLTKQNSTYQINKNDMSRAFDT
jgi:hypothetical protein